MNIQPKNRIRVPARIDQLGKLVDFVLDRLRGEGVEEKTLNDLHLAIDEACTNCVSYSYPEGTDGEIEISCRRGEGDIAVSIRDWGPPFNPLEVAPPDLTLDIEDRPIGGLGVFLMKKFSDRLEYRREDGANVLTIFKKIGSGQ